MSNVYTCLSSNIAKQRGNMSEMKCQMTRENKKKKKKLDIYQNDFHFKLTIIN
jgi:hypothetical protein